MVVAWAPRVENVSREVEEGGAENKKAHATIAVWAGFHNKKHLAQETQRGIMRREGKHESSCPGRYVSDCASPAAAENSSLLSLSPADDIALR